MKGDASTIFKQAATKANANSKAANRPNKKFLGGILSRYKIKSLLELDGVSINIKDTVKTINKVRLDGIL